MSSDTSPDEQHDPDARVFYLDRSARRNVKWLGSAYGWMGCLGWLAVLGFGAAAFSISLLLINSPTTASKTVPPGQSVILVVALMIINSLLLIPVCYGIRKSGLALRSFAEDEFEDCDQMRLGIDWLITAYRFMLVNWTIGFAVGVILIAQEFMAS